VSAQPSLPELFELTILTHAKHTQACTALHDIADQQGLRRERIVHSSALSACLPMVLEGLGVALLPKRLVKAEIEAGVLHLIKPNWLPDPLSFYARYAPTRVARYVERAAQIAKVAMQTPVFSALLTCNFMQEPQMAATSIRLGVDIGGTFTDVVLEKDGEPFSTKVLTTYAAPENAIIDGMHQVCKKAGVSPSEIDQIIHGTTLATNALIERRGAKTALITTEGFRDVIEMRTESRFEQYDLNLNLPDPLLPRQMRFTVGGRVDANGAVLVDIDRGEVEAVVDQVAEAGFESVAVGLIHSYLNASHEELVREVLAEKLPHVSVSISSEVSPQMREYERFNTVVANAYIKPLMASYLGRLEGGLRAEGVRCRIFLMHSGGGIISIQNAADFPVRLVESGPAGGAVFAAHIAARYGLDKVLSFDMGGTTAKICLIKNQTPKTSRVFEVARTYRFKKGSGMPISIPVIDMVEIGAGGGSLAHVDAMRQIRVGPESAGS
jgi:N-methylhydantoinase A